MEGHRRASRSATAARAAVERKRSYVEEFFDADGSRKKRPMTRRQTRMFELCDEAVQDYEHNAVDVLPDDALLLVLARMAPVDLLPLRLVCRRWNELILEPALWRRHQLTSSWGEETGASNLLQVVPILYSAPAMDTVDLPKDKRIKAALMHGSCKMRALRCSLTIKKDSGDTLCDFFQRVQPSLQSLNLQLVGNGIEFNPVFANVLSLLDDAPLTTLALRHAGYERVGFKQGRVPLPAEDFTFRKLQSLETLLLDGKLFAPDLLKVLVRLNRSSLHHVTCTPALLPELAECPHLVEVTVEASSSLRDLHKLTTLDALTIHWTDRRQAVHIRDYLEGADAVEGLKLPSEMHLYVDCYCWDTAADLLSDLGKALSKFTTLTYNFRLARDDNLNFMTTMDSLQTFRVEYRAYKNWVDLRSSSLRKIELTVKRHWTVNDDLWLQSLRTRWPSVDVTVVQPMPEFLRTFSHHLF